MVIHEFLHVPSSHRQVLYQRSVCYSNHLVSSSGVRATVVLKQKSGVFVSVGRTAASHQSNRDFGRSQRYVDYSMDD